MLTSIKTLAATGHRPQHIGGFGSDVRAKLYDTAFEALRRIDPAEVIIGMAVGWDMAVAEAAIDLSFYTIAVVPCAGQSSAWPEEAQKRYRGILARANEVVDYPGGPYAAWKLHARNHYMVDRAQAILALWNGRPIGGTFACIEYANKKGRPIINEWSNYKGR